MAKHSHLANIKHKKGINDKKKGAVIAKMGKLITIAVSLGGPKLEENPRLAHRSCAAAKLISATPTISH